MPCGGRCSHDDRGPHARKRQGRARDARLARAPASRSRASTASVLIGMAAVILFVLSGLVLMALKPPSLRLGERPELFNVEHKPVTDALAKLPASYDGRAARQGGRGTETPGGRAETGAVRRRGRGRRCRDTRRPRPAWWAKPADPGVLSAAGPGLQGRRRGRRSNARRLAPRAGRRAAATTRWLPPGQPLPRRRAPGTSSPAAHAATEPTRKLAFLKAAPDKDDLQSARPGAPGLALPADGRHHHRRQPGHRPQLRPPGFVIAQVTEHVYDSVSGPHLLIPQGLASPRHATTTSSAFWPEARARRLAAPASCPMAARS